MQDTEQTKNKDSTNKGSVEDIPKLLDKLVDPTEEDVKEDGTVDDIPKLLDSMGGQGVGRRFSEDFQQKMASATSFVGSFLPSPSQVADKVGEATKEVGKVTSSVTKEMGKVTLFTQILKEGVAHAPLINSFNKEQEEFIKNMERTGREGLAPWKGYQNEEELKAKILALSGDKRNVTRSPPAGVNFDFEYKTFAASAAALLKEDPELDKLRYELVPKVVKEENFWRNYAYRVDLVKQSFLLNQPHEDKGEEKEGKEEKEGVEIESCEEEEEWEADLEGELNEFQVVGAEHVDEEEVDNQIKQMLEAEKGNK